MPALVVKRVYSPADPADGTRILVDRLWPRGMAKDKAHVDLWLKDLAPSNTLRQRFHGKPEDWQAFRTAYAEELTAPEAQAAVDTLRGKLHDGPVTLLFAARDEQHNNAVALRAWLLKHDPK